MQREDRNETRRNYFTQRIVEPWNSLPEPVADAPSKPCFKARLDKHWRQQDIVYNHKHPLQTATTNSRPNEKLHQLCVEASA